MQRTELSDTMLQKAHCGEVTLHLDWKGQQCEEPKISKSITASVQWKLELQKQQCDKMFPSNLGPNVKIIIIWS